jgi:hypothetical protein
VPAAQPRFAMNDGLFVGSSEVETLENGPLGSGPDISLALGWKENRVETGWIGAMESSADLFPALTAGTNVLFQELVGRTDSLQLLETPLEQHRPEIGERPLLAGCVLLKLGSNLLTDSDADLYSPFSHFLSS